MAIRVLLADDHQLFREGVRSLLEKAPGVEVVGEAADGRTALGLARETAPDVVIMDISMPDLNGFEATRKLKAMLPQTRVIALSAFSYRRFVKQMLEAGAQGYLVKDCAFDELIRAVRTVANNLVYLSPVVAAGVVDASLGKGADAADGTTVKLSPRQREVLQLIVEGHSAKQIAARLHVSVKTVGTHRQQIMKRVGAGSVVDLIKYALREGLTPLD
jgi:DNA-binding NarL/FixJ family response regulator